MIDFDRFWSAAGCFSGMTREETEAQVEQMGAWLTSIPGAVGQFDKSLVPGLAVGPGVTDQQIADWENQHGVRLPDLLRSALSRQDCGFVRGTQFRILALESQRTVDGRWKNSKSRGSPVCVQFESSDPARLQALRRDLFGDQAAESAEDVVRKLGALYPEIARLLALGKDPGSGDVPDPG